MDSMIAQIFMVFSTNLLDIVIFSVTFATFPSEPGCLKDRKFKNLRITPPDNGAPVERLRRHIHTIFRLDQRCRSLLYMWGSNRQKRSSI
jgi:hypothetical protein